MNYDFSRMQMSAATGVKKEGEAGQEGEGRGENRAARGGGNRGPPRGFGGGGFGDDDDFQVVSDKPKKQRAPRREA